MAMRPYVVVCSGCGGSASYKIAARWSDGVTCELKTYALCCPGCVTGQLGRAQAKQAACRLAAGETLEAPGVYELTRGRRDVRLTRREDLERSPDPA